MSSFQPLGDLAGIRIFEAEYDVAWKDEHNRGVLVDRWRIEAKEKKDPEVFDLAPSGMRGGHGNFAQECLMYLLWRDQRCRSIAWYKLAADPSETKGKYTTPSMLKQRHEAIANQIGVDGYDRLRTELLARRLTTLKGEPDLFCWYPGGKWFFAEVKDEKDGLRSDQVRWMLAAKQVFSGEIDLRIYLLRARTI